MHTNQINSDFFHIVTKFGYNMYTFETNMQSKKLCAVICFFNRISDSKILEELLNWHLT